LLVDPGVLGKSRSAALDRRRRELAAITLGTEVGLDRLNSLVAADTPFVAVLAGVVPRVSVAETDFLDEKIPSP